MQSKSAQNPRVHGLQNLHKHYKNNWHYVDSIYSRNLITTKIKKRTLKKLLKYCFTKNVFTLNDIIYEQMGGVSMGSCLWPLLANIIMTELESSIVGNFFKDNLSKLL